MGGAGGGPGGGLGPAPPPALCCGQARGAGVHQGDLRRFPQHGAGGLAAAGRGTPLHCTEVGTVISTADQDPGGGGADHPRLRPQHRPVCLQPRVVLQPYALYCGVADCGGRYRVLVVEDGCGDRDIAVHNNILAAFHGYNCLVIDSDTFICLPVRE